MLNKPAEQGTALWRDQLLMSMSNFMKSAAAHPGRPWLCTQAAGPPGRRLDPPGRRAAAAIRRGALLRALSPRACPRGGAPGRATRAANTVGRRCRGVVPRPAQERVREELLKRDALERVAAQQPVQQRAAARRQRARHGRRQRGLGALDVAQQLHMVGAVEGRLACARRAAAVSRSAAAGGSARAVAQLPQASPPPLCTSSQRRQAPSAAWLCGDAPGGGWAGVGPSAAGACRPDRSPRRERVRGGLGQGGARTRAPGAHPRPARTGWCPRSTGRPWRRTCGTAGSRAPCTAASRTACRPARSAAGCARSRSPRSSAPRPARAPPAAGSAASGRAARAPRPHSAARQVMLHCRAAARAPPAHCPRHKRTGTGNRW